MADTTKRLPRTVCSIAKDRKQLPIEEKESLRWLDTHAQEIAQQYPETNMVAVADSEADIFEVIEADKDSPENFQWIIRGCFDRATVEDPPAEPPTLRIMIRLIARLGGYIDRARDDEPGPDTTMPSMERLHDIRACWLSFGPKSQSSEI